MLKIFLTEVSKSMKRSLDEVNDIYQGFLAQVGWDYARQTEVAHSDGEGNESLLLIFSNDFHLKMTNKKGVENSADLHCWWYTERNSIEVESLEQLLELYHQH